MNYLARDALICLFFVLNHFNQHHELAIELSPWSKSTFSWKSNIACELPTVPSITDDIAANRHLTRRIVLERNYCLLQIIHRARSFHNTTLDKGLPHSSRKQQDAHPHHAVATTAITYFRWSSPGSIVKRVYRGMLRDSRPKHRHEVTRNFSCTEYGRRQNIMRGNLLDDIQQKGENDETPEACFMSHLCRAIAVVSTPTFLEFSSHQLFYTFSATWS